MFVIARHIEYESFFFLPWNYSKFIQTPGFLIVIRSVSENLCTVFAKINVYLWAIGYIMATREYLFVVSSEYLYVVTNCKQ